MRVVSGVDVAALRALAEAATPGPWTTEDSRNAAGLARVWQLRGVGIAECRVRGADNHHDAAFIAAANPTAVLALLDEIETLRAKVARVEALADRWPDRYPEDACRREIRAVLEDEQQWRDR